MILPDTLDFTEIITMTPASAVKGLPLSGGMAGAVRLEPAGLTFYEPATLRITPAAPVAGPLAVGFGFDGGGDEFHLRPTLAQQAGAVAPAAGSITLAVHENRGYGAGSGTQEDIARQQAAPGPVNLLDKLTEEIASEIVLDLQLAEFYTEILAPHLRSAATNTAIFDQALREFDELDVFHRDPPFAIETCRGNCERKSAA